MPPTERWPFQAVEPRGGRFLDEPFLQVFALQAERHVHQRTAVGLRGAAVEAGPIDFGIELTPPPAR